MRSPREPTYGPAEPALHLHQHARVEDATAFRLALTQWATACRLPRQLVSDVELAVYEAVINAVEHAYPADAPGLVDLRAHHDDHTVRVTVTDYGRWQATPQPDPALRAQRAWPAPDPVSRPPLRHQLRTRGHHSFDGLDRAD
ncbi:ATP-binding protein [Amycolatopsis sp. NPDC051903]|uniref:ATP-binding protein n=1 Tax=Amycolatopsis sp. NPDC051903 TaxID=3363936 RepID=UPI00379752C1